jgi:hypothetical protein
MESAKSNSLNGLADNELNPTKKRSWAGVSDFSGTHLYLSLNMKDL